MTPDIESFLPDRLSDEAATVLYEVLSQLALAVESRYLAQLRRYHQAQRLAPDPEQPWKTPIK